MAHAHGAGVLGETKGQLVQMLVAAFDSIRCDGPPAFGAFCMSQKREISFSLKI